jgi:predicted nicotinamide N-methyase
VANSRRATFDTRVGRYGVASNSVRVGSREIELLRVADLEALVDRDALIRADDPDDPPYWAHLWTGAIELARHVDSQERCAGLDVLDVGCGLGLVGIVAALNGGRVTFLDREADALAFAAANAERNGCRPEALCQADFTTACLDRRFELILGAEVLYDAAAFAPLVQFLTGHLVPMGRVVIADAYRTDTRAFYVALTAAGYCISRRTVRAREERLPVVVDVATAYRVDCAGL